MAAAAMAAGSSFQFAMESILSFESEGATFDIPITMQGEYLAPDRSQGTVSLSVVFFTIESQFVTIGDSTYVTDPNGISFEFCVDTPGFVPDRQRALELLDAVPTGTGKTP